MPFIDVLHFSAFRTRKRRVRRNLLLLLLLLLLQPFFRKQLHGLLRVRLALLQRKLKQHFGLVHILINTVPIQIHDAHVQRSRRVPLTRCSVGSGEKVERASVVAVAKAHVPEQVFVLLRNGDVIGV